MAELTQSQKRILTLFDVDGTLTPARQTISPSMKEFITQTLREKVTVGIVGGSDLIKQIEQIGPDAATAVDYNFSQNGLVAYKNGALIATQSIQHFLGEENIKELVNFSLRYFADLDLPFKRGTFIEFRTGMINMSPVGRNCSTEERNMYEKYDLEHKVRETMIGIMKTKFAHLNLCYSIGGQISFDVFPQGWDKTYCLNFIPSQGSSTSSNSDNNLVDSSVDLGLPYDEIHFFGDKTFVGGNDYEIFTHSRVIGHTVTSPEDCRAQCEELFMR